MRLLLVHSFLLAISILPAAAVVNVYGPHVQQPLETMAIASASHTSAPGHNNIFFASPPLHDPLPSTSFHVQLEAGAVQGLSIPRQGSFFGFSLELGLVSQVFGLDSALVPFLNLMDNIMQLAGSVHVRVGGNTRGSSHPANTPLIFTSEVIRIMAQISSLTNVRWYLYTPSNDIQNVHLQIAEDAELILGDYLGSSQTVSEPNLHSRHDHRLTVTPPSVELQRYQYLLTYCPNDDQNVFRQRVQSVDADSNIPAKDLVGPGPDGIWQYETARSTGFVTDLERNLVALIVERRATDDCYAQRGMDAPCATQESSLTHRCDKQSVSNYLDTTAYAQRKGLPYVMLEANLASCGGFPCLSDSITIALWAIDYGLQLAYMNFTRAMLHIGGDTDYYNPFMPPATGKSTLHQWSVGPVYYSTLFVAEALGSSRHSQVLDLRMNSDDDFTPGYAIYENGRATRVVLINFFETRDYTASISIGGMVPSQVKVKYLLESTVTEKHSITWAGQTFGSALSPDGRPVGAVDVQVIDCDQTGNICNVTVHPGAALVFLSLDEEFTEPDLVPGMTDASNKTTDIADTLAGKFQNSEGINVTFGLPHALPTISGLIAVCAFVCLESLLSYAITGTIPWSSVSRNTKKAR